MEPTFNNEATCIYQTTDIIMIVMRVHNYTFYFYLLYRKRHTNINDFEDKFTYVKNRFKKSFSNANFIAYLYMNLVNS